MAGDWIKMTSDIGDKPEVRKLSRLLSISRYDVVGRLHAFWSWVDKHSSTGECIDITCDDIDDITDLAGFADALRQVGWLTGRDASLGLPHFDRHNGQSAKARSLESEAKRIRRQLSDECPTKNEPNVRPEKRREEKSNNIEPTVDQLPKRIDEVEAFMGSCLESPKGAELKACANSFYDDFSARGWRDIKGIPLRDWKPAARKYARTWAHNNATKAINNKGKSTQNTNEGRCYS